MNTRLSTELPSKFETWIEFYEEVKYLDHPIVNTSTQEFKKSSANSLANDDGMSMSYSKFEMTYIISKVKDELFRIYLDEQHTNFTYDELYQLRVLTSHQGSTDLMYKVDRKMALESDRRFKKRLAGY